MRRLLVTLGVVGLFAALTVAITWPQAAQPAHARGAVRRLAAQHLAHLVDRARAHVGSAARQRQHLPPGAADARLHRRGLAARTGRGAVHPWRRVAGDGLQPADSRFDRVVGGGDVPAGAASHRKPGFRDRRGNHLRLRHVPLRSLHAPGAAGHDLPAAGGVVPRPRVRIGTMARHGGVRRKPRPAGAERHLLRGVPRHRAGRGHPVALDVAATRQAHAIREADSRGGAGLRRGRGALPGDLHAEPLLGRRASRRRGAPLLRHAAELSCRPIPPTSCTARGASGSVATSGGCFQASWHSGSPPTACGAGRHGRARSSSSG